MNNMWSKNQRDRRKNIVMSYLWNIFFVYEMSCLWNVFYEISYLWNVLYEFSYLWIVISMKCPVYEMSYLWNVLSMKYFSMKWPNTILSKCVLCSTVHLALSGSQSAQYMIWTGEIQWCSLEQNIALPIFIYFCYKQ